MAISGDIDKMEPPRRLYRVGAWTPERLCRAAAALLILAHLGLGAAALTRPVSSWTPAGAHAALIVFYLLLWFEHFPVRTGLLVVTADAVLGAAVCVAAALTGAEAAIIGAAGLFLASLLLSFKALAKIPRHERW